MKKPAAKQNKKVLAKRDFEKEYAEIMKGVPALPAPQWNKPGDAFVQLSMYTHHSNGASSKSTN